MIFSPICNWEICEISERLSAKGGLAMTGVSKILALPKFVTSGGYVAPLNMHHMCNCFLCKNCVNRNKINSQSLEDALKPGTLPTNTLWKTTHWKNTLCFTNAYGQASGVTLPLRAAWL